MDLQTLSSPVEYVKQFMHPHDPDSLANYEAWWQSEGNAISSAVDRVGTPWLRMFDKHGRRVDEILFPPEYWRMLRRGYESGLLWKTFEQNSLFPAFEILYVTSFYDPGLACPYTVSLSTAAPISKYGNAEFREDFLFPMLRRDGINWQGATWMTEIKGGSDLGASVETVARPAGKHWLLTGDKYFASNVGAELAVVAARIDGAPQGVRGLSLFLVPRYRRNGELNYFIRRLKDKVATRSVPTGEVELRDSEAYLLGHPNGGIYLILEVLNISRIANSIGSVALAQRAISDALTFAQRRIAFGKPIIEHPLLCRQFTERLADLRCASALAWESVRLLNDVWQERAAYSDRYHLFRLVAHLAKYWTAEFAVQTAKWAMEVHGAIGVMQEFGIERWLREATILAIWEGTSHRQILDGLEVMERKRAHESLFQHIAPFADRTQMEQMRQRVEELLALHIDERQSAAENLFRDLAQFTGETLTHRPR